MSLKKYKLSTITEKITKGTTPTTLGRPFTDSGINFIKIESIDSSGSFIPEKFAFIDEQTHQKLSRSILEDGDVLFSIAGAIGRSALVDQNILPANTNQALAIIRPKQSILTSKYLFYMTKTTEFQGQASGRIVQTAQANVNLTQLGNVTILVPHIYTQTRIADILSAYYDLIENNRQRIALLEQAARLLYREWFVYLRFPGHEHVRIVDGVPEGWAKGRLDELATINRASLKNGYQGEIEYVDISSVTPGKITETTIYRFEDAPSRARRIVQHGDIIWSCVRPNRRSHVVIWKPVENLIVSTGFAVITPTILPTSYLYFSVTTSDYVGYLDINARGVAYPAVTASDFEKSIITVPTRHLINLFDDCIQPCFDQIHILDTEMRFLAQARDLLLPRLMNGEIAV